MESVAELLRSLRSFMKSERCTNLSPSMFLEGTGWVRGSVVRGWGGDTLLTPLLLGRMPLDQRHLPKLLEDETLRSGPEACSCQRWTRQLPWLEEEGWIGSYGRMGLAEGWGCGWMRGK